MDITDYGLFILSVSILSELLLIFVLFAKIKNLEIKYNHQLKWHGVMIRFMRREGMIVGEDLIE
jgi:hypothetical protein